MVAVPDEWPLTTPKLFIDAVSGVLLLHVPPAVASLNAEVSPAHMLLLPVMGSGVAFIVITVVAAQPVRDNV